MTDSVSLSELLRLATKRLDSQFIGSLLSLVFELQLGASKTKMLNLILSEGLSEYLFDGEFLEALGEGKLRSSHLVKYVFFKSNRFSVVSTQLKFLLNAERLNIFNRSTLKELHKGMGVWPDLDTQSLFWFELMQELDRYRMVERHTSLTFGLLKIRNEEEEQSRVLTFLFRLSNVFIGFLCLFCNCAY